MISIQQGLFSRWLLPLLIASAIPALAASSPPPDPAPLIPGELTERFIDAGGSHRFHARLDPGPWLLTLRQHGANVAATWTLPSGERVGPVDSPTGFRGPETALLILDPPGGDVGLELTEVSTRISGHYSFLLKRPPEPILAAERTATEGGRALAAGERGAAVKHYRRALSLSAPGDLAGRARLSVALAVLLTRDEPSEAVRLHRQAVALWRQLGEREWEAIALNRLGLALDKRGQSEEARPWFAAAIDLWRELGDPRAAATVRRNQCLALQRQGQFSTARSCYENLLELYEELGDADGTYRTKYNLVGVYWKLGQPDRTLRLYDDVLATARTLGDEHEAPVLQNRAMHLVELGEVEDAILDLDRALEFFRRIEDRGREGTALRRLADAYQALGECERALHFSRQALPLLQAVEDQRGEASALRVLGQSAACLAIRPEAFDAYGRALELSRTLQDVRGEAEVRRLIGKAHAADGSLQLAAQELRQAASLQRRLGDRRLEARALLELGTVLERRGEWSRALEVTSSALETFRDVRDRGEQARTLEARARFLHALGRTDEALANAAAAVELLTDLRARAGGLRQRTAFLAARRDAYDLYIHLLMERHRKNPRDGWDRRAFGISEQARSRALLDALDGFDSGRLGRGHLGNGHPGNEALRAATRRLAAAVEAQMQLLAREHAPAEAAAADRDVYEAVGRVERLRIEARRAAGHTPETLGTFGVEQAQELLDEQTLFVEIALGEKKGYLWAVSRNTFESFELPGRDEIENLARRVHKDLGAVDLRTGRTPREARERLGRLLLESVADSLERFERVAVAADGALHYVPFAALPWKGPAGQIDVPLIETHELVALPSATALAVQRRARAERIPTIGEREAGGKREDRATAERTKSVAIFADPVFAAGGTGAARERERDAILLRAGIGELVPLPATRVEAEAIAALVPPARRLLALGTDARRDRVLGGELAQYRYVHFATHGVLNARHPELSGVVLSQIDENGTQLGGYLSMEDLYGLDLEAELVVLSGCHTALGREARGEGLLGLGHGLLAAGAKQVAASLWAVQDNAAAELMARFYRAMLQEGQTPAAALAAAARSIRAERRWSDPYFWAAFVLVGDWR